MTWSGVKTVVLGASGAVGRVVVAELLARGASVRVCARGAERLARAFASMPVEVRPADALHPLVLHHAILDCAIVFDCIDRPVRDAFLFPAGARHLAWALRDSDARAVVVSNCWSYAPLAAGPIRADHPRAGRSRLGRYRRRAEDLLTEAGVTVAQIPEVYGDTVCRGPVQELLEGWAGRRRAPWPGHSDGLGDHGLAADLARDIVDLAMVEAARGRRVPIPGAGPITLDQLRSIAAATLPAVPRMQVLGRLRAGVRGWCRRDARLRAALRADQPGPLRIDGAELESLLGRAPHRTPHAPAIAATLHALRARHP